MVDYLCFFNFYLRIIGWIGLVAGIALVLLPNILFRMEDRLDRPLMISAKDVPKKKNIVRELLRRYHRVVGWGLIAGSAVVIFKCSCF